MVITSDLIKKEISIAGLFLLASVIQSFFMCYRCTLVKSYVLVITFNFFMWVFLWRGNSLLTGFLSQKISWFHFPLKRFLIGLVTTIAYSAFVILGIMHVYQKLGFNFGKGYEMTLYISIIGTVLISLFLHSWSFLEFWRQSALEAAKFQRESISAKYETLKSKVNPSFLFNSLNALSDLVHQDKDRTVKYIKQLSDVYRYMLETRQSEVVSLDQEMKFLQSYAFLLNARQAETIELKVSGERTNVFLPPLALHMLIENVLGEKNIGSGHRFRISRSDDAIKLVYNKLQGVEERKQQSLLDEISHRYRFLGNEGPVYEELNDSITISLPLLAMDDKR